MIHCLIIYLLIVHFVYICMWIVFSDCNQNLDVLLNLSVYAHVCIIGITSITVAWEGLVVTLVMASHLCLKSARMQRTRGRVCMPGYFQETTSAY